VGREKALEVEVGRPSSMVDERLINNSKLFFGLRIEELKKKEERGEKRGEQHSI